MKKVRFYIALWVAKVIVVLINIVDKKKGSNLSGKIGTKICPEFIKNFTNIDFNKCIIVTGTNGKSTTTTMIMKVLRTSGKTLTINEEGANLMGGIATALVKNSTCLGKIKTEFCVFEVDERTLPAVYKALPVKHICITNLQKDQTVRNGEPDYIYQKFASVINKDTILYLNNDEPRSKALEEKVSKVIYYGMEQNEKSFEKNDFYDVTLPCPKCNHKIKFDYYNVDNIGKFECTKCDYKNNEEVQVYAKNIDYKNNTFECLGETFDMTYSVPFFIYSYAVSIAACNEIGISLEDIKKTFSNFVNVAGRMHNIKFKDKQIYYVREKQENPETLQSAFNYVKEDTSEKVVVIGLSRLEDFNPFHTNTFYLYDCNCNEMVNSNVEKYICFTESVCYDTANRLIYEGVPEEKIVSLDTNDVDVVLKEIENSKAKNVYLITWIHLYEEIEKSIEKSEMSNDGK